MFNYRNAVIVNELYVEKQGSKVLKATSTSCIIEFEEHPIFTIKVGLYIGQDLSVLLKKCRLNRGTENKTHTKTEHFVVEFLYNWACALVSDLPNNEANAFWWFVSIIQLCWVCTVLWCMKPWRTEEEWSVISLIFIYVHTVCLSVLVCEHPYWCHPENSDDLIESL